jgi:mannose-6-phosphate isomerase-like protein (cupin superfamily)
MPEKQPIVRHREETPVAPWAFGEMQRIVTGGDGGVANVHVAKGVANLPTFYHTGYDEIYYITSGEGTVTLNGVSTPIRPGSVVVIPSGVTHALEAEPDRPFEFVIFGSPPIGIEDERAKPRRPA